MRRAAYPGGKYRHASKFQPARPFLLLHSGRAENPRKNEKSGGARGKNNFLLKWLRKAQDNNIFHPDITSEIEWLRGKIIQAGHDTDLEPMLEFVYATARRAEMLKDAD